MLYPCPACGFNVFQDSVGSYDICPICSWEDDAVQLRFPDMRGGANGECLYEWQQKVLSSFPLETTSARSFDRDPTWRPLSLEEAKSDGEIPKSGFDYFNAIDVEVLDYYWRS
jgi:hypothetical protein